MVQIDDSVLLSFNQRLAEAVISQDQARTLELLAECCRTLVSADTILAAVYGKAIRPLPIYDDVRRRDRHEVVDSYLDVAYLLDPFYRAGIEGVAQGLYRLADVEPPGFEDSEFFRQYYHKSGIKDEIGFLTYLHDGCFINFSLLRMQGSDNFSQAEIEMLRLFEPLIHRLLVTYWKVNSRERGEVSSDLHAQLEAALSRFGNSVLTEREAEVIRMYLKGHSTASITERLGISYHTVSTHRKSAYQKLDITSQGELFHLFIDSISCFDPDNQRDPLRGYLDSAH